MIFTSVAIAVFLAYAVLIIAISIGWIKLDVFKNQGQQPRIIVSLIIAVRNEAPNINALLNSLINQDYPAELFEIILVDDHSSDHTALLIEEFLAKYKDTNHLKLICLEKGSGSGKKAALSEGIRCSIGELIVITDADCTAGSQWISTVASFYDRHKHQMILGPVRITDGGSLFGKFQSLEFSSLISSAAGSCNAGFPILANGANIAFTRRAYESCGGLTSNMHYPSGDDMFLMMSIKKKFGSKAIRFLRSEAAIVNTPAIQAVKPFIQQRMRWVSKSRGYTDPLLIAASMTVFLTNAMLLLTAFAALISTEFLKLFLSLYVLKLLVDLPLMLGYNRFQKSGSLLWMFPFMELINALYTGCIGIAGNILKNEWKGRKLSASPHKK